MDQTEQTREIAYRIWESEGRPEGRDIDHWLQAEDVQRRQRAAGNHEAGPSGDGRGARARAASPAQAPRRATPATRKPAAATERETRQATKPEEQPKKLPARRKTTR